MYDFVEARAVKLQRHVSMGTILIFMALDVQVGTFQNKTAGHIVLLVDFPPCGVLWPMLFDDPFCEFIVEIRIATVPGATAVKTPILVLAVKHAPMFMPPVPGEDPSTRK